jgi:hypothetical protein
MKFVAEKCSRMTDEDGNVIVSFKVTGYERRLAEMAVESSKKLAAISVELTEKKSQRSLDQNAMLWSLITKLSLRTCGDKSPTALNQLYCAMLEEANCVSEYIVAPKSDEMETKLTKAFRAIRNMGARTVMDKNGKPKDGVLYQCFIGSSKFTTAEMSSLIETTLDKCAEFGIVDDETERIRLEYK